VVSAYLFSRLNTFWPAIPIGEAGIYSIGDVDCLASLLYSFEQVNHSHEILNAYKTKPIRPRSFCAIRGNSAPNAKTIWWPAAFSSPPGHIRHALVHSASIVGLENHDQWPQTDD